VVTAQSLPAAAAQALAPLVAGPVVDGQVIAVLGLATYLECPRGLVALLAPGAVSVPVGLRPADGVLPALRVGDPVRIGDGQVRVRPGDRDSCLGWAVHRWWPSAVRPRAGRPGRSALDALRDHLPALPAEVPAALPRGAAAVVGLGEGLTPLGDDVLAGLLVAWAAWPEVAAGRRDALVAEVVAALPRTTPISAELLRLSVDGHAATPVLAAVAAVAAGDPARIHSAATDLLAVGHTSGLGLAHGLLWGMSREGRA